MNPNDKNFINAKRNYLKISELKQQIFDELELLEANAFASYSEDEFLTLSEYEKISNLIDSYEEKLDETFFETSAFNHIFQ